MVRMSAQSLLIRAAAAFALVLTLAVTAIACWLFSPHPSVVILLQDGGSNTELALQDRGPVPGGPVRGLGLRTYVVPSEDELGGTCRASPRADPRRIDIAYVEPRVNDLVLVALDDCRITWRWNVF